VFELSSDSISAQLEVTVLYELASTDLFFKTYISLKNIGSSVISNVYYERALDALASNFTSTWVRYQPSDNIIDLAVNEYYPYASTVVSELAGDNSFYATIFANDANPRNNRLLAANNETVAFCGCDPRGRVNLASNLLRPSMAYSSDMYCT
jgi:hypothetical protein